MHSPCIRVHSLLSAREYTAPIHSPGPHPNTSLLRVRWTPARILRLSHTFGRLIPSAQLLPATRGATSAPGSCKSCAVRPRRTAVHFFPHTRPPDTHSHFSHQHTTHYLESGAARLEYQSFLVNTYFSLVLSSMPCNKKRGHRTQHGPRPAPAVVNPCTVDNTLDEASDIALVDGARDMSTSFAREGSGGFDSREGSGGFDRRRHDCDQSPSPAACGIAGGGFGRGRPDRDPTQFHAVRGAARKGFASRPCVTPALTPSPYSPNTALAQNCVGRRYGQLCSLRSRSTTSSCSACT
jgi:hypothetical protein